MKKSHKSYLKFLLKLILTALALYFVINNIDLKEAWKLLKRANPLFLLLAWMAFLGSKFLAAIRLNLHFSAIELIISQVLNLRLYLLGMYYNLFLPGGIGGDGYKAYWLNKQYNTKLKDIIGTLLLDRINGLVALGVFALIFTQLIELPYTWLNLWVVIGGIILAYWVHYLSLWKLFRRLTHILIPSHIISLIVQALQLLCVYFLLHSLGVEGSFWAYGFVFLVSSIVSVLPLTIGGIGSREVVFLLGSEILRLEQGAAITISVMFYLITVFTSLLGSYYAWVPARLQTQSSA